MEMSSEEAAGYECGRCSEKMSLKAMVTGSE